MVQVGDIIYIETCLYLKHGKDDVAGGKAHVASVSIVPPDRVVDTYITVLECPNIKWNWSRFLSRQQESLKRIHKDKWAHAKPDMRSEFNKGYMPS